MAIKLPKWPCPSCGLANYFDDRLCRDITCDGKHPMETFGGVYRPGDLVWVDIKDGGEPFGLGVVIRYWDCPGTERTVKGVWIDVGVLPSESEEECYFMESATKDELTLIARAEYDIRKLSNGS